jgi:hypothetical protein
MFTAAVVVGGLTVGAAAAAVGAGATGFGVYRHKKKQKQEQQRHKQTLNFMNEQWQEQKYNSETDPNFYPHAKSPIDNLHAIPLRGLHSFAMGWDEDTNINTPEDVEFFAGAFSQHGQLIHTISQHTHQQTVPNNSIFHTGYLPRPELGRF